MKREGLLCAVVVCAFCLVVWVAVDFRQTQERALNRVVEDRNFFHRKVQSLKEDLSFLEAHGKEVDFLNEKGWLCPKNRLIAGEFLESLRPLLKEVSYQFDPETVKEVKENMSLKVTQMSFETVSIFDVEVYAFLEALLSQFPGILILRDLSLRRDDYIHGKVVVDWLAMGEEG